MADLPEERLEPSPPFSYCGVDLFGPWYVKEGCKELKRYGVVFTCLASRAVHLEVCQPLETDSFLNALRRFLCRRGPIRQLRADQGSNFIGARRELREALSEMDQDKIKSDLLKMNCDWIEFRSNAPTASHMGGVWERHIRTVRSALSALLKKNGSQLNDEALRTFMCEAEAVINSRPLTTDNTTSSVFLEALTPNHLLTTKTKVILTPPPPPPPPPPPRLPRRRPVLKETVATRPAFNERVLDSMEERISPCSTRTAEMGALKTKLTDWRCCYHKGR